jgi:hypothetical protein
VVVVNPFSTAEIDFVANNPGLTLFHCRPASHGFRLHELDQVRIAAHRPLWANARRVASGPRRLLK